MLPKPVPPHFVFIQGTSHGRSKKDNEAQLATARSHAARFAHRRKNPGAKIVPGLAQILSNDQRPRVFRIGPAATIGVRRLLTERSHENEEHNETPFSDYSCSPGLRIDPFFCIDTADDKNAAAALDFCAQAIMSRYDLLFKVFNMTTLTDFSLGMMASEPAFYHVTIAATQMILDGLYGLKPSRMMLHHRGIALSILRKRLAQEDAVADPSVMCTMLCLALLEKPLNNQAGYTLHRNNLSIMLSSQRGSRTLQAESKALAFLTQYDYFWAAASGETLFPIVRLSPPTPPTPILSASQKLALINNLPEGFQQLARQGSFSLNTIEILNRAAHACRWSRPVGDAHKLPSPAPSTNDILEASPCLSGADSRHVNFDKLALLTVVLRIFLLHVPRMLTSGLMGARVALSRRAFLYEPTSQPEHDFIIWVVVSTVEAWHFQDLQLNAQDVRILRVLVNEFVMRYPNMRDLAALRRILVRFFGIPQESKLRVIHEAMMQHVGS